MSLAVTYLGAQSMGASTISVVSTTVYTVPVTVPAGGVLVAIEAAWRAASGTVAMDFAVVVFADASGEPGEMVAASGVGGANYTIGTSARWITKAIPALPPGDYHIGAIFPFFLTSPSLMVDTGGSTGDGHTVVSDANGTVADGDYSGATVTATSSTYSVRGVWVTEDAGITGTLAETETDDTLAASGTATPPALTGSLAETEADDTLAASGTVTNAYTGSLAEIEDDDSLAASGSFTPATITGALAETEADDTLAASGTRTVPTFTGSLAETEADDTLSAAGTVVNAYTGTLAVTEENDTLAASGAIPVSRWREPALTASVKVGSVAAAHKSAGIGASRKEVDLT